MEFVTCRFLGAICSFSKWLSTGGLAVTLVQPNWRDYLLAHRGDQFPDFLGSLNW